MRHDNLSPTQDALDESPSADHSRRFFFDQTIRKAGYSILSRPSHGEPVWEKSGRRYLHSEVLARLGLNE
jgi:hypothetical protein